MRYSQASEVGALPGAVLCAQRMAGCSAEPTGFSGDDKCVSVVKHVLPEAGGSRSSPSSLSGRGPGWAPIQCAASGARAAVSRTD